MSNRSSFYAFDWRRFRSLESALKEAAESGDFGRLEDPQIGDVLESFDDDASTEEICNALVADLCLVGRAVTFDSGLTETVHWLRKQRDGVDAAEWLGGLITAAPRVAEWFACETGIAGLLTEEETRELSNGFAAFRRRYRPPAPPRGLTAWWRRFAPTDPARAHLDDLMDLVDETGASGYGLALVVES